MGLLDSITGGDVLKAGASLVGGILGAQGTADTNQANKDIAAANNAWSAQQYATRYQTTVKDLEAAGLNPMLAYMNGTGGSAPTAQQVTFQNPMTSAVDAFNQTAGQLASSQSHVSSAHKADTEVGMVKATTDKVRSEIDKIKGDTNFVTQQDILKQTAWSLQQQGVNFQEQGMTAGQSRAVMGQTIQNLKKDGTLKQLDIDAAQSLDNLGRQSRELKPVVDMLRMILK